MKKIAQASCLCAIYSFFFYFFIFTLLVRKLKRSTKRNKLIEKEYLYFANLLDALFRMLGHIILVELHPSHKYTHTHT
jgi:hypothetical protein